MPSKNFDHENQSKADNSGSSLKRDEEELFAIRMLLKQHDHQLITTEERLTLLITASLPKAFTFLVIFIGVKIAVGGLPLADGVSLIKTTFFTIGSLLLIIVAVSSAFTQSDGLLTTAVSVWNGSPKLPERLKNDLDEHDQNALYKRYTQGEISEATARNILGDQFYRLDDEHTSSTNTTSQDASKGAE